MAVTAKKAPPTVQRNMEVVLATAGALKEQLKLLMGEDNADAITIRDTIEGETDLFEVIAKVALQIAEDESRVEGISAIKRTLDSRKQRLENRAELLRGLLINALDMLAEKKLELPLATISVKPLAPKLVITDEPAIHSAFWKKSDPVLDRQGLGDHLKARKAAMDELAERAQGGLTQEQLDAARTEIDAAFPAVNGAELSNGGTTLQIRFI